MTNESLNILPPDHLPGMNVEVPYVLVADHAFQLNHNLMKPNPGTTLDKEKRIFNYPLSRACRAVENAFGHTGSQI